MNRKEFIKTCGYACLAGFAVSTLLESCSSTSHIASATSSGNKLSINKSEFVTKKGAFRKFVLVNSDKHGFPICIYKINENEYSALLMQCTHNSCELNPQESFLVCPCHGSEFNNKGVVQSPPAEKNLQSFATTTDNEKIYIQL